MDKRSTSRSMENSMRNNPKTSKPDITRRHYSGAGEDSRSQQRPHADLGSSSSAERKTTTTAGKDHLYSPSQPDKRISRGPSSSYRRGLHTSQPSWRQARKEASAMPTLEKRFSGLAMKDKRLLRGGEDTTYNFSGEHTYRVLGIPVSSSSYEGKITVTKEDTTEHQPPAETGSGETGSGETAAAETTES